MVRVARVPDSRALADSRLTQVEQPMPSKQEAPVTIRIATAADSGAVAALLSELGYPDSENAVAARLAALIAHERDVVLVAVRDSGVCAVASIHLIPLFHRDDHLARVTSFVVAESHRRQGVGSALITACEAWAHERGAKRVEITSGDQRDDAHAFYERHGFGRQGVRLTKSIPPD